MIDRAAQQATRAGEIIRNSREFLRRGDMSVQRVAVPSIARHALETIRPLSEQHRVRVEQAMAPGLPDALVDPIQVEQVLINLLRNSVEELARAGEGPHEVVLAARVAPGDPGMIEIAVRDNGPASRRRSPAGFSRRSPPPRKAAWAWAFRSAVRSSRRMAAASGPPRRHPAGGRKCA